MDDIELLDSSEQKKEDSSTGNPATVSDDSGESDSDSEDEAELNHQIETLESELSSNPYNYDAHVQYIKLLKKTANLEKLRQSREAMSAIFPLSPSLWLEWAKDEASQASSDNVPEIVALYERGLSDYQSVSLWCDYLNFLREFDPSVHGYTSDGISKMRSLFERAIPAAGFHVTEGNRIWEGYREFEQGILATIDKANVEEINKQIQRIRSIFHRHLSVPLENLSSTLMAYKAWELEQGIDLDIGSEDLSKISPQVAGAYKKAQQMYSERAYHEGHISKKDLSDTEKFQQFMNYIKFEQTSGDPTRVQAIYERALAEYPVSSDLWTDYTCYLDKTLKVGKAITHAYSRATRSCPWSGDLWARYLLALECGSASEKEIYAVFEKSLQCTFSSFEEYLDLYLTRVDGLRRRMLSTRVGETLDYSLIRETFQQASDYLTPRMQNTESLLRLHAYWADLELSIGKDLSGARGVWESFLKKSGGMLAAWHAYIDMEVHLGHVKEARSIYRRCYTRKFDGTGSEDICHAWLQFEREHGALEDIDHAVQKVTPRLEELQFIKLRQESAPVKPPAGLREHNSQKGTQEKKKAGPHVEEESLAKQQKSKDQKVNEVNAEGQSDNRSAHADNEGKNDDKSHPDRKKRVKRRKNCRSSRSMTISERLGAIDKTSADIELGILDALEVATKVAQEVAREVESGELSHSSSEEYDESGQSGSQDSHDDDLHIASPSKGLPVGEESHVGDDNIMDEKKKESDSGMMDIDDIEESHLAGAAKSEVRREKSPCGFDLNQDICPDDTDVILSSVSTNTTIISVSHSVSTSGMSAAPLQLERSLSGKGSAASSVFNPTLPHKLPRMEVREKQVICRGIDLNVSEAGDDQANLQGPSRFDLDLNCTNEDDDDMPPPSEFKMETRLFLSNNRQQSASPVSSLSVAQQSGKEVNFNLNDRPQFFIDARDQSSYYGRHPWSTAPYGGHKLEEPAISILGTKVDINRKDSVSQMASFLSNGKSVESTTGLYMPRMGNSLGLAPGVSFSPAPIYGYNGVTGAPGLSLSSPMYVPGTAIPYMVDSRGTPVMMPQIIGSTPYVQPPFPQQHLFMSLAGGSPSLNGSVRPNIDQSSGFGFEIGNRESLSLRQFLSPEQSGEMGEHSGANLEPSSSSSISIGGKRKEPETRLEFPLWR